jgi:hypothetical protein
MTLPVFPLSYYTPRTIYPKGDAVRFGRGYSFAIAPQLPLLRTFQLNFEALQWFFNIDGTVDYATHPEFNAGLLEQFYQTVTTYKAFTLNHPQLGAVTCRFAADSPLELPKSKPGGTGVTEPCTLMLTEVSL